ncbi:hypothetical protein ACOMHN_008277 [Nucella lapillus]
MTEDGVGKRDPMAKAIGPAAALVSPELLDVMNAGFDDDEVDKIGEIAERSDSLQDEAIAYEEMDKPETRAMEVQPDLRNLEPRNDPRAFMPFAPIPTRRYTSLPFESQRRLIPVPEEEGSADERLTSPEEIFNFPIYALGEAGEEDYPDVDYPPTKPLVPQSPPAMDSKEKT